MAAQLEQQDVLNLPTNLFIGGAWRESGDRRRFDLSIAFAMSIHVVTVFGGTGFLGRRVVRHLRKHEFSVRIASRDLDRSRKLFGSDDPCLQSVEVDILDERMVADVLAGAHAAMADNRLDGALCATRGNCGGGRRHTHPGVQAETIMPKDELTTSR